MCTYYGAAAYRSYYRSPMYHPIMSRYGRAQSGTPSESLDTDAHPAAPVILNTICENRDSRMSSMSHAACRGHVGWDAMVGALIEPC